MTAVLQCVGHQGHTSCYYHYLHEGSYVIATICKSNQPVSLTFAVMIEPTSRKNLLTFGADLQLRIPDHFSTSLTTE